MQYLSYTLLFFSLILISFSNSYAQHKNILISNKNDPEEITICINPKNPNIIIAAANTENYYFSSDTGKTWRSEIIKSSHGVWGDPCLIIDSLENFYYFHLSKSKSGNPYDRLVCQKSYNKGVSWSNGTYFGLNGSLSQDKEWAAIDPKSNFIYATWTEQKKKLYRNSQKVVTDILVSVSKDFGKTWSDGLKINEISGSDFKSWRTVIGAMPAIGPKGEVFATWVSNEGIFFDKSIDSGKTWIDKDTRVANIANSWSIKIPGVYRSYVFPIIACDISNSLFHGDLYITWADQIDERKNTDIWISKSTNLGLSWSKPVKVNNDSTNHHQYSPWITIDQANGNIYIVFYDRRNHQDNKTDVFIAKSTDGGQTFTNFIISERFFTPNSYTFMGDYIGIAAFNNIVRPVWTSINDHSKLSVWTAIINTKEMKK